VKKVVGNGKVTHDEVFDMDESVKNERIEKISESLKQSLLSASNS